MVMYISATQFIALFPNTLVASFFFSPTTLFSSKPELYNNTNMQMFHPHIESFLTNNTIIDIEQVYS